MHKHSNVQPDLFDGIRVPGSKYVGHRTKWCPGCHRWLILATNFTTCGRSKTSGLQYWAGRCKRCSSKDTKKAVAKKPGYYKSKYLHAKFGITLDDYNAILEAQGGVCAICKQSQEAICKRNGRPFKLAVDHCHVTGKHRGLLCSRCNPGLGSFRDNPNFLRAAADYLDRHNA